ncbi:MAG: DUF4185 domain-containing protein [Candidatus Thorarchaeota archaeon]
MPPKRRRYGICFIVIVILMAWLAWPFFNPEDNQNLPHQLVAQLTGSEAISDSTVYDVGGTDLGIIVKHDGQYLFIFGDTFSSPSMTGNWRSNTIAISEDTDPSDGISVDSWVLNPTSGYAKELISSLKVDNIEMTCIPTAAVSLFGNLYVYYMSVRHWSEIGGIWTCNNASIAVSTNNGQSFTKMTNISWAGNSNFVLFGVAQPTSMDSSFLYLLSTPAGRFGACYLSRVEKMQILNQSAYQYYTGMTTMGDPIWSSDPEDSSQVFSAPVGEVSLMWNEYLDKWTAFYTDNVAYSIVVRSSEYLWGPWSEPFTIVDAEEYPSLYGSFVHPDYVENSGETTYFIMSIFTEYNTFLMSVDVGSLLD